MIYLAFILAIVAWPIVTLLAQLVLTRVLMPTFWRIIRPSPNGKPSFGMADVFGIITTSSSQILVVLASKGIYWMFGLTATRWLAVPFGLWCLVVAVTPSIGGRPGRHADLSNAIGLFAGLAVGILWII